MSAAVAEAVSQRVRGERPSRARALAAAAVAGVGAGVLTYRILRAGNSSERSTDDEGD